MISQISKTIATQISRQTKMLTMARDFVAFDSGLMFRIRNNRKIEKFIITLNASDLYDLEHVSTSKRTYHTETLNSCKDVYVENLNEVLQSWF